MSPSITFDTYTFFLSFRIKFEIVFGEYNTGIDNSTKIKKKFQKMYRRYYYDDKYTLVRIYFFFSILKPNFSLIIH